MVIEVPPTEGAYLQVWGFLEGQNPVTDELTLLSEVPVSVLADSWVSADMVPLRSN